MLRALSSLFLPLPQIARSLPTPPPAALGAGGIKAVLTSVHRIAQSRGALSDLSTLTPRPQLLPGGRPFLSTLPRGAAV